MEKAALVVACHRLMAAYHSGKLGQTRMPEDSSPEFTDNEREARLAYFTLPMALNYQRDSYKLWEAALATYRDTETRFLFDVDEVVERSGEDVRAALLKHRLALQPNKHTQIWRTIAHSVHDRWGSFEGLMEASNSDFLTLKRLVQTDFKKDFPYLSGPKIFNYWSFILSTYGSVMLRNRNHIDIAPDTHIIKCSVKLAVITQDEAENLTREEISERWRLVLAGSGIDPIDMHPPLWFWSRNGFVFNASSCD